MVLKSGDYPWCVIDGTGNRIKFICERCLEYHHFNNEGMTINEFCKKSEAFCELHKNCKLESSMETKG